MFCLNGITERIRERIVGKTIEKAKSLLIVVFNVNLFKEI